MGDKIFFKDIDHNCVFWQIRRFYIGDISFARSCPSIQGGCIVDAHSRVRCNLKWELTVVLRDKFIDVMTVNLWITAETRMPNSRWRTNGNANSIQVELNEWQGPLDK